MSRRRFPVLLVAALFVSTLALANSISVSQMFLHSGALVRGGAFASSGDFSISAGKATPMNLAVVSNRTLDASNAHFSRLSSGKVILGDGLANRTGRIGFSARGYEPTCCKAANWVGGDQGYKGKGGLSAPEPGSLILLSTGLLGIAGLMRRKLLRG